MMMMMMMMMMMIIIIIIIVIIIIIIIIIIIAFKGAIREFLQSPHCAANVSNTYAQVARAQQCANHVQHIERLSRATCVTCHLVRMDSSAFNTFPTEHLQLNYFPCKKLFDWPFPFGCPVSLRFPKHQQQTAGVSL